MLTFRFSDADGVMVESDTLTSGMTGKIVKLEFTSDWENLTKTAVFTAGPTTVDVLNVGEEVVIPHEVLQNYGDRLYVGIYGIAEDGTALPTIYARGPRIQKGADPSGDESTQATPPVWAQLQTQIDELKQGGTGGGGGNDSTQNGNGVTTAQANALREMFRVCVLNADTDVDSAISAFETAFGLSDSGEDSGGGDDSGDADVTLARISATYVGGDVPAGTAVADLSGITVTAHYSDGSSSTVTGYTLSGTIAEGNNTVTVTYQGMTTTVTVTGVAVAETYAVTNNLTNVTTNNSATTASGYYSATLSWASGYAITSIIVTMGGVDVTDQVYGDGSILITEVTGDIVITAEAGLPVLYQLANTPVTCNADLYEDTGLTLGASDAELYAKNWTLCATFTRTENCTWLAGVPGASTPNDTFGIRGHLSDWSRFPQFVWCKNAAADFVDNGIKCKMIVTHEANANNVNVYSENAGGFISTASSAYGRPADAFYAGTLYVGGSTAADFIGTIEDFTIYGSVLSEADINAYLGVA